MSTPALGGDAAVKSLLDEFSRELDAIERRVPMTHTFERVDPYVIQVRQPQLRFDFIVFHVESKLWYDHSAWSAHVGFGIGDDLLPRRGDVVFDIGCNAGFYAVAFALMVGPEGAVHAFDPFPWNALATRFNARLNGLANVHAYDVGIGGWRRRVTIASTDARIYAHDRNHSFDARIVPLDDFAHLRPDFLKIDIEGAERELALGAREVLAGGPRIYMELHRQLISDAGWEPTGVLAALTSAGYRCQVSRTDGKPWSWNGEALDPSSEVYCVRATAPSPVKPSGLRHLFAHLTHRTLLPLRAACVRLRQKLG